MSETQSADKVVFVSAPFRHHGLAYFDLVLAAIASTTGFLECLDSKDSEKRKRLEEFDQYELRKKLDGREDQKKISWPEGWRAVLLAPSERELEKSDPGAGYRDGFVDARFGALCAKGQWKLVLESLERDKSAHNNAKPWFERMREVFQEQAKRDPARRFLRLECANALWRDLFKDGSAPLRDLWHVIHSFPLVDQLEWWRQVSPWKEHVEVVHRTLPKRSIEDGGEAGEVVAWTRAIERWLKEQTFRADTELVVNLYGCGSAWRLAWLWLAWAKAELRRVRFVDCPTRSDRDDPRLLRPFRFVPRNPRLLEKLAEVPPPEGHHDNEELERVREQLKFYVEQRDHFVILVLGPRGSGKSSTVREVFGSADGGGRSSGKKGSKPPFVVLNAASLSGELVDSELFGHVEGAFTGANRANEGAFGEANGGVLFIDEFHRLPDSTIGKLLVALQTHDGSYRYRRVGDTKERKSRFQLVLASNLPFAKLREHFMDRFPDFWDRILQRVVEFPPLRPNEIEAAWDRVWERMKFSGVKSLEAGDKKRLVEWLKLQTLAGNYRDLEFVAIVCADLRRAEQSEGSSNPRWLEPLPQDLGGDPAWLVRLKRRWERYKIAGDGVGSEAPNAPEAELSPLEREILLGANDGEFGALLERYPPKVLVDRYRGYLIRRLGAYVEGQPRGGYLSNKHEKPPRGLAQKICKMLERRKDGLSEGTDGLTVPTVKNWWRQLRLDREAHER